MKKITILFFVVIFFSPNYVYAEYVLPYPSILPGNKLYSLSRFMDKVKQYWYLGNLSQAKYHLMLADKYLVEARTLMEYKQYSLGTDALENSNLHFRQISFYLQRAAEEGKNIPLFREEFQQAKQTHLTVLFRLKNEIPSDFTWRTEKGESRQLFLADLINNSIALRKK